MKQIQPDSEIIQDVIENPSPQESQVLENTSIFVGLALFPRRKMHFQRNCRSFHSDELEVANIVSLAFCGFWCCEEQNGRCLINVWNGKIHD